MNLKECWRSRGQANFIHLVRVLALLLTALPACAGLRVWTGLGPNAWWSTGANWNPSGQPQNGDDLFFPAGAPRQRSTNDLDNLALASIGFTGASSSYELWGNLVTLAKGVNSVLSSGSAHIYFDIALAGHQQFIADGANLNINRNVAMAGFTLTMRTTTSNSVVFSAGEISGLGDVEKVGVGEAWFGGPQGNSYQGTVRVAEGILNLIKGNGGTGLAVTGPLVIGDRMNATRGRVVLHRAHMIHDAAAVLVDESSTLDLNGWDDAIGPLDIRRGAVRTGSGTLTLLGPVRSLGGDISVRPSIHGQVFLPGDTVFDTRDNQEFILYANISGPGGIIKEGVFFLHLTGTNSFTGPVTVNDGVVIAERDALGSAASVTLNNSGGLILRNLPVPSKPLTITSSNAFLAGHYQSEWRGPIFLNFSGKALCSSWAGSLRLSGSIQGTGGLEFGGGEVELTRDNTFTGPVRSACTQLLLNTGSGRPFSGNLEVGGESRAVSVFATIPTPYTAPTSEVRWVSGPYQFVPSVKIDTNGFVNLNGHTLRFGNVELTGGRIDTAGGQLELTGGVTTRAADWAARIDGSLELVASQIPNPFDTEDGPAAPDLVINAIISDSGVAGLTKRGPGELLLSGANTYRGNTLVNAGVLHIQNASSLGTASTGTTVSGGATLQVEFVGALAEPLNIAGTGHGGTLGALHLLGGSGVQSPIVLDASASVRVDTGFGILGGVISGAGPFIKTGGGSLQFGGGSGPANTYTGDTTVLAGELVLNKPAGVAAVPGHLVIGGGGGLLAPVATVRHFSSFTILGSVTVGRGGLWNLNGNEEGFTVSLLEGRPPLTLSGGGDVQTGSGRFYLPAGGDIVVNPGTFGNASSFISGSIGLDSGSHRFVVNSGVTLSGPEVDCLANIHFVSGTAGFTKIGPGTLRLAGNNDFNGELVVDAGRVIAASSLAFGLATAGTFVNSNASLILQNAVNPGAEMLTLNSDGRPTLELPSGSASWGGLVQLNRTAELRVGDAAASLALNTSLSGAGGLIKSGDGRLDLGGGGANSYGGLTVIQQGQMQLLKPANTLTVPGDIIIGDEVSAPSTATLRPTASGQLWTNVTVSIRRSGFLDCALPPASGTILQAFPGSGRLNLSPSTSLTIHNSGAFEFSGALTGSDATLHKNGGAMMHLSGDSPGFAGLLHLNTGTVKVDGNLANLAVLVWGTSVLRGDGTLGSTLIMDPDGVIIVDSKTPGRLGGDLNMGSLGGAGGIVGVEFFGPSATGGNEQLISRADVVLTDKRLSAAFFYPPREGDVLTVIRKDAPGAIQGNFTGWPEGATVPIGDVTVRASYGGGDGNDFILTVTNLPLGGGGLQLVNGSGGSAFVPNDCNRLWLTVTNRSGSALTGLRGNLRSLTPGIAVTISESTFPDLAPEAGGTNTSPFQIRTEPSFGCGSPIELELTVAASNTLPFAILYTLAGTAGTALSLDGVNDNVSVTHTNALDAFPLTVTAWFQTTQRTEQAGLITKYRHTPFIARGGWQVSLSDGNIYGLYDYGGDGELAVSGGFVADGEWHHVAFTVNLFGAIFYVDGVFQGFLPWDLEPIPAGSTTPMRIGTDGAAGFFAGIVEEVTVWNRSLSEAEIQANMRRSLGGNEPGLLAYYPFNEGRGTTTADSSPAAGSNNGTLIGGATFILSSLAPFTVPGGPDCNSGRGACESCIEVSGLFTTNTPTTLRALNFVGAPSICLPPKPCPETNFYSDTVAVPYIIHAFTNNTPKELCLTAQLRFECEGESITALGAAAYLGANLINSPCANYLGDTGADGTQPFSFHVPPRTNFVMLVSARTANILCDRYTLELFGLPCPPPTLHIAKQASNALLHWSSAYPDFHLQSVHSLEGPAIPLFVPVSDSPVLVNGRYLVTNTLVAPQQFFRLAK